MIKLVNLWNNFSKKILFILPLSCLFGHLFSEIVDLNDPENMVRIIINEASQTMGKLVDAKEVRVQWCQGTYYSPSRNLICLNKERFKEPL